MTTRVFFHDSFPLAQMFTPEVRLKYMAEKFFDDPDFPGCKMIEAFAWDIRQNLVEWACSENEIYYRTEKYWYVYWIEKVKGTPIIKCTRHSNTAWARWDTWMNLNSCCVGKDWLDQEPQKSKRVLLFNQK